MLLIINSNPTYPRAALLTADVATSAHRTAELAKFKGDANYSETTGVVSTSDSVSNDLLASNILVCWLVICPIMLILLFCLLPC